MRGQHAEPGAALCDAASTGDVEWLRAAAAAGVDLGVGDYDKRTAVHLAASERARVQQLRVRAVDAQGSRRGRGSVGWLAPGEYLHLSRQAFGVAMLDECIKHTDACAFDGDSIYTGNSTTGGEVELNDAGNFGWGSGARWWPAL